MANGDCPIYETLYVTIGLLICSNVFMSFAWYARLKELTNKPWIIAAFISWGVALPARRGVFHLPH